MASATRAVTIAAIACAFCPEHQGRGLGKQIMTAVMEHLRQRAPHTAYISLIADGDARHLYARYGFAETAPESVGVALRP